MVKKKQRMSGIERQVKVSDRQRRTATAQLRQKDGLLAELQAHREFVAAVDRAGVVAFACQFAPELGAARRKLTDAIARASALFAEGVKGGSR